MNPLISVIMSVHNQAQYLPSALYSLKKQTYKNCQHVFIDDASTDSTWQILQKYKTKSSMLIKHQYQCGLAKSLNQGIRVAKGEYIARMDADDIAHPTRFAKQVKFLQSHSHVAACGTAVTLINQSGEIIGKKSYPTDSTILNSVIMRYNPLVHPTTMMRTAVIRQLGGYDESLNGAEDYDLWLRVSRHYQLANLPETLLQYRVNPQGISWNQLKNVEWQSLRARLKAIVYYGYPKWQAIYLIKPLLSFLVPSIIKKTIFDIKA